MRFYLFLIIGLLASTGCGEEASRVSETPSELAAEDEVVPETGRSEWTPRIGAPRDEVKASGFLNSELVGDETADATTQLASAS